jgi:GT2 family glycosyltransferase
MSKPKIDLNPLRRRIETAWRRSEILAAEGRIAEARALLERAHRRSGSDQNLALALALLRLRDGDAAAAATLFASVAGRHDVREAWTGLATAGLMAGDAGMAAHACARALRAHVPDAGLMAAAAAATAKAPGWCGVTEEGEVLASHPAKLLTLTLDGTVLPPGTTRLPPGWETAERLRVQAGKADLLGSPVDLRAITRVEGFAERTAAGIKGWAWHPAAPDTDPPLRLIDARGRERQRFVATDLSAETDGDTPCARPRAFALTIDWPGPVRILGGDGADLAGSPVAEWPRAHAPAPATPKSAPAKDGPADVVIPVYRGITQTLACIDSVLGTVPRHTRVWVVDDGSPERGLVAALQAIAATGRIRLIASGPDPSGRRNLGFPAAANAGLRAAAGRDVVLLNADTLVAPLWLRRLQRAAHSAADIGTATPLSNEASIFSVPDPAGGNPPPDLAGTRRLAALAARANAGVLVDVPTAHGFCMFIRAACLAETGLLRDDLFAQGYGEENDFCVRAQQLGWRHVAAPSVYVAHAGGVSFGASRKHLLRRNLDLLDRLHPFYHHKVAAWIEADPLFAARRRLDEAIWRERAAHASPHRGAVLLVTHDRGGGTARVVASRASTLKAEGFAPLLLNGRDGACELSEPGGTLTPNLRFRLPSDMPSLIRLLAPWRPAAMEIHHLLGHDPTVRSLAGRLKIPIDEWVHDYAFLCPRITLSDGEGRYCGEPPPAACEACVGSWGREDEQTIAPAALRARSVAALAKARSVIVPSADVASRVRRHAPGVAPMIRPWAQEAPLPPPAPRRGGGLRVAVIGAIGVSKGFSVILACAKDASARALNLSFAIVGYTVDDDALEATGHVTITGPFEAAEAASLIRAQGAGLAFIPSTWPETWCFALTDAWEAGLPTCVFDIGTQAQRVRASGFGWVLPLGLPPERVNDRLLALSEAAPEPVSLLVSGGTIR